MRLLECLKYRIEIPLTFLIFAFTFSDSVVTNWLMYKTCYISLGINETECALIGSGHTDNITEKIEEKVQPYVTVLALTKSAIEAIGSLIVCCFLGPWSDKYGRKPVFLLTFGGYILAYATLAIISAFSTLSPWFFLLYAVPLCFTGGITTLLGNILCYVTDITSPNERGIRIAIFYGVVTTGFLLGSTSSSYALKALGYFLMFLITSLIVTFTWLYTLLIISESLPNPQTENRFHNLFKISAVKESVKVTFKQRDSYNRAILMCIITLLVSYVIIFAGDSINYLYLMKQFGWDLKKFTLFSSALSVIEALGSIACIFFLQKLFRFNESLILVFSLSTSCVGSILFGLATTDWHIYLASAIRSLKGTISPMSRTIVSKIVTEDCGKVFSFMALCETVTALIGSSLYTFIYNKTLSSFPGAFCLFTASIYLLELIMAIIVVALQRKQSQDNYSVLSESTVIN